MKTLSSLLFALAILAIIWTGVDHYLGTHIVAGVLNALQTALQMLFA